MGPFPFESFENNLHDKIISPINHADSVVAVSYFQAKQIKNITGKEAVVIPNVVDEDLFSIQEKKQSKIFSFLSISGFDQIKGLDILLKAFAVINSRYPSQVKLQVIAPVNENEQQFKEMATTLGIGNNIEWLGKLDRSMVIKALQSSDCYICSSRLESFGVSIVEALACGKPVISTNCGGPADIVNEINGILVGNENITELATAMEYIKENINKFQPKNIREDFLKKYSRNVIGEKYNELYSTIIQSRCAGLQVSIP
jgi:glycosyltransferase involved in cell wall biosynthesis